MSGYPAVANDGRVWLRRRSALLWSGTMGTGEGLDDENAIDAEEQAPDDAIWFAQFALRGERFDARGMPAESASEVTYYRNAMFEMAREIWLERHDDRYRVPTGFEEAFDLRLVKVDEGSSQARVFLNRPARFAEAEYNEWFDVYNEARDRLTGVVDEVGRRQNLTSLARLTKRERGALRKLGSTLEPDERIQLGDAGLSRTADFTLEVRQMIRTIDAVLEESAVPQETSVEGVIVEFDSRYQRFELRHAITDQRIICLFPSYVPGLAAAVRGAMAEDGVTAPDVRVTGYATMDDKGGFDRLVDVGSVEVVRPWGEKRLRRKLREMRELESGWLGPGSVALSEDVASDLEEFIPLAASTDVHLALASTSEGHAVFEWKREGVVYSAEIEPGHRLYLCVDNLITGDLQDSEEGWVASRLLDFVLRGALHV